MSHWRLRTRRGALALTALLLGGCQVAIAPIVASPMLRFVDSAASWLVTASIYFMVVAVVLLLPLASFRKTRPAAAVGFGAAALLFFVTLWAEGLYVTIVAWGIWGVVLGLLLAGAGIAVTGILACLFAGQWDEFFFLTGLAGVSIGAALFAQLLFRKILR